MRGKERDRYCVDSELPHVLAHVIRTRVLLTGEHEVNEWLYPSHVTEIECPTGGDLRSPFGEPHTHFKDISLFLIYQPGLRRYK